ncbi:hypothetical protein A9Q99_15965 [Gammaproteobacteria bacterium 45_16_T64]|nr:hypothetical protein A9Q99_15965 [Gammaproteobacteria bacterium 45_16_T64]
MTDILLIDDDEKLGSLLGDYFEQFSLTLTHRLSPSHGFKALETGQFSALILDVMLPEMDGFEMCKHIRSTQTPYQRIPIIMLTARGEVTDRIVGLELGADDYLPKPFEPRELVARIQNIARRQAHNLQAQQLNSPEIHVDLLKEQAFLEGDFIELTSMEFSLLIFLMENSNRAFTRDEIMNNLRGIDADLYSRAVDTLVSRLRHKLKDTGKLPRFIKTVWGKGYSFIGKVEQC